MDVQEYNATKAAADSANPVGSWTGAPSLAATGVNMKNTSSYAVWADVVGGTVSAISAANEPTGLTSGSFLLQPGQNLNITYSVAPTVSWRYQTTNPLKPKGAWAGAPAVAATTVPMANNSGFPIIAYVIANGATVASIKVNGVTLGIITGTVRLDAGDTLTLTYSAGTPAVVWIYG